MEIVRVDPSSPYLAEVKKLWRVNSDTLGMMPDGAFDEHAGLGHVLGVVETDQLLGYLLFRSAKGKAKITHLCAAAAARGRGIARLLVNELVKITSHLSGIELKCRRDFDVSNLWPKLGFFPARECVGRAVSGSKLTVWWMDYGKPSLFSHKASTTAIDVVIDTNVLIDIVDRRNDESLGLRADWLQDEIRLCVTEEVLVDFHRQADEALRLKRFSDSNEFPRLAAHPTEYQRAENLIKPLFPNTKSARDESDVRQLIHAVAADVTVFVSRDGPLLDRAEEVYTACGLSIVRPAELIARIDELVREEEYQRALVAGTRQISRQRVGTTNDDVLDAIRCPNETKRELETLLHSFQADPHRFDCEQVTDQGDKTLAVYVVDTRESFDRLPMFRVCSHRLAGTLSRTILTGLIQNVIRRGKAGIVVTEPKLNDVQSSACSDLGFLAGEEGWFKLAFTGIHSPNELANRVEQCGLSEPTVGQLASSLRLALTPQDESEIEHVLWPVKVGGSQQSNFIVPIRPEFAQDLFDEHLARQTLWGANIDLALNPESAYYRSARSQIVKAPGRILWYVSDKGNLEGRKAIRACSRIAEVVVDKPKTLFRRFKRLGVYEWSDVFETAKHSLDTDIMAIRFHDTELIHPVPWDTFQEVLRRNGINTNLESPISITSQAFEEIYALALNSPALR